MLTIIPAIILIGAALKYRVNKIHNNINIHIYAKISSISIYITCVTNQSTGRFPPVIFTLGCCQRGVILGNRKGGHEYDQKIIRIMIKITNKIFWTPGKLPITLNNMKGEHVNEDS